MIANNNDKIIDTMIDVIIGKWKDTLPFLNDISPGNFPIHVQRTPITIKTIPIKINIFPNCIDFTFLIQNVHMLFR